MNGVRFINRIRRLDWLNKPTKFSQSTTFNKNDTIQLNNRQIQVEYDYDISFETNRKISQKEYGEMQNALNSVIICYGDKASDGLFLWERMFHSSSKLVEFMHGGDVSVNYFAKRYVLAKGNDIGFVSENQVFVNKKEQQATV